jgi:hypothetical protein
MNGILSKSTKTWTDPFNPPDLNTPGYKAPDEYAKMCKAKCYEKRCEQIDYFAVQRPELGDYSQWNWSVGCEEDCGEPQGSPTTGKY